MRFLVDAQLPPSLGRWIGDQGYSASAVRDVGFRDSDDGSIVRFATAEEWVIVTKDEDLIERCVRFEGKIQVVWLRIENCTNPTLFQWLKPLWPQVIEKPGRGERIVEVRKEAFPER
jgi:predicted nuclease of predicted toxin-antitoxin system